MMKGFDFSKLSRRELFKLSMMTGSATLICARRASADNLVACGALPPQPYPIDTLTGSLAIEAFATSPVILNPFNDPLTIPKALRPGYQRNDGSLLSYDDPGAWGVRSSSNGSSSCKPGPDAGMQDCMGARRRFSGPTRVPDAGTHQLWPGTPGTCVAAYPKDPLYYHIRLQVNTHKFTSSPVQPILSTGLPTTPPANVRPNGSGQYNLPDSTIYGFNGQFPGPMINAMYGQPACVRFENDLDLNPMNLDRQNFGAPDWGFLTHLHNGHTAPESDGQPHHMFDNKGGYQPTQWVDNLYLNYPAGGNEREKQSFFWFHDHRMHHTGANVYKGLVGLYPIYDPILDPGDENQGLKLPGVRVNNGDGTFDVKYDIPMALYDCRFEDGVTQHQDYHNGCGEFHPEWWGKTYFRHFPDHGFVGDVFTVNGTAYPKLEVDRRKYRFRFLGASVSRCYELVLMKGTPKMAAGTQGQWTLSNGQKCMQMTQIASEGGLLPKAANRDSVQVWPAKRREVVVDFTKYQDGSQTKPGDVVYLVNVMRMQDGREPDFNDPGKYKVMIPLMKIVIGNDATDNSAPIKDGQELRPMPVVPNTSGLPKRTFTLQRGNSAGGETQWLINGLEFNPLSPLASPRRGSDDYYSSSAPDGEVWTIANGGGGWTHPFHMHMEEHTVLSRSNSLSANGIEHSVTDKGKEDVVGLDPSESVTIFRRFRTFYGNYVAHCHNLAHEDHNMMFGWSIIP